MRAQRATMGEPAIAAAASRFAEVLEAALAQDATYTRPGIVAGYWPVHGELDVRPALRALRDRGWQAALPVVVAGSRVLAFQVWEEGGVLLPNRHGVMEPAEGEAVTPDVILVPGLAFDARNHRLGYGGGYYDATLAALPDARSIGCGYEFQRVDALPAEAHDMRLDKVIFV